jgi:hypothetical protein
MSSFDGFQRQACRFTWSNSTPQFGNEVRRSKDVRTYESGEEDRGDGG